MATRDEMIDRLAQYYTERMDVASLRLFFLEAQTDALLSYDEGALVNEYQEIFPGC